MLGAKSRFLGAKKPSLGAEFEIFTAGGEKKLPSWCTVWGQKRPLTAPVRGAVRGAFYPRKCTNSAKNLASGGKNYNFRP